MPRSHQIIVRLAIAVATTVVISAAAQAKTLSEALADAGFKEIAGDVETCVLSHSPLNPQIAVSVFASENSFGGGGFTTAGKAIVQAMKDTIQAHTTLDVVRRAEYTLRGDYLINRIDERNQRVTLRVNCRIVNRDLDDVAVIENEFTIVDPQAVAEFTGVSLEFPQADDATEEAAADDDADANANANDAADDTTAAEAAVQAQSEALDEALGDENPQAADVTGTVIRPAPDSPFGIEIRLMKKGASLFETAQPTLVDGRTHVHVDEGDVYEVRLINDTQRDVAVMLSIDGVNVFTFADPQFKQPREEFGTPVYSYYIVERGRVGAVSGWFKNLREVSQFEIAPQGQAAAGRVGVLDKVGTITATFSFAWRSDEQPPADEIPQQVAGSRGVGTKEGRLRTVESNEVRRFVGGPRATVSVRYSDQ